MILRAVLIATILARPVATVQLVYQEAERAHSQDPVINCALVEHEAWFNPKAWRIERDSRGRRIGTSWGLYQLCDIWHVQFRADTRMHCYYGAAYLYYCLLAGGSVRRGLARYNAGEGYADSVLAVYQRLEIVRLWK